MEESDLILDYAPRRQFVPFHARRERFALRAGAAAALSHPAFRPHTER
jgi:hypothetical protein